MSLWLALALAQAEPLVAIVVVDEEARESGYALEVDGFVVGDALPIDVAPGERLSLLEPDGDAEPLHVRPGEVWEIVGADGQAWMSELDRDVRSDVLLVQGELAAIETLAQRLNAEVVHDGDRTWLAGEGILLHTAWVEGASELRIDEISPVRVGDELPLRHAAPQAAAKVPIRRESSSPTSRSQAAVAPGVAPTPGGADEASTSAEAKPEPEVEASAGLRESSLDFGTDGEEMARYAGLHLCGDDMLWLHPAGMYSLRAVTGEWSIGAPGVVRMRTPTGEVLFRASIDPETGFCRDVWTPEEAGNAMPEGYERFESTRKKKRRR